MSRNTAAAVHLILVTLGAANQYLMPAFTKLNPMQLVALTTFLGVVFQAYQMVLGLQAYELTPGGQKAAQSEISTTFTPTGDVAKVVETHKEPSK